MTDYKSAPTMLKRGMPPEQSNGLYGTEDRQINLGVKGRFTAVVTFEVADIRSSEADQKQYPLLEFAHIEPIWDPKQLEVVRAAHESEYKKRTGANQLNFGGVEDEAAEQ